MDIFSQVLSWVHFSPVDFLTIKIVFGVWDVASWINCLIYKHEDWVSKLTRKPDRWRSQHPEIPAWRGVTRDPYWSWLSRVTRIDNSGFSDFVWINKIKIPHVQPHIFAQTHVNIHTSVNVHHTYMLFILMDLKNEP